MTSTLFRIEPLPADVVRELRARRMDDMANPLVARRDSEPHQCRYCLRVTEPWEPYLAVSYAPMPGSHPFVERGPIYIHERDCGRYAEQHAYPNEFPKSAVVLRAYGETDEIRDARYVGDRPVEAVIAEMFADPGIRYMHARNLTYGCFMFRIERKSTSP